jgi:hypothetical protein
MAATVHIERWTGSGAGSGADITSTTTRMKQADNGTADTNNPVPAVTTSYSYWVSTRLNVTVAAANSVSNLQWYSDGTSAGTGLTIKGAIANVGANAGYRQATAAVVLDGPSGTNHTGTSEAPVNVTTYTSGSPHALAGSQASTGAFGDFFVYQLSATSSAAPGPMTARTFTWQYDET